MTNDKEAHLLARQVELLYVSGTPALLSGAFVALVVALTSYLIESGLNSFFWLTAFLALSGVRYYYIEQYIQDPQRLQRTRYWEKLFLFGVGMSGFLWGLTPWFMFNSEDWIPKFFLFALLTGISAVSLPLYSQRWKAYALFVVPLYIPLVIEGFMHGGLLAVMSVMSSVTCVMLVRISRNYHDNVVGMLELDAENAALSTKLDKLTDLSDKAKERESKALSTLEEASIFSWTCDQEFNLTHITQRFKEHTGHSISALLGGPITSFDGSLVSDCPGYNNFLLALKNRSAFKELELHIRCINGACMILQFTGKPVFEPGNDFSGFEGFARDVTASSNTIENLTFQAQHDQLTGLLNRKEFSNRISGFVPPLNLKGRIPHVASIDIRRLKVINDNLGMAGGDEMFCQLALILSDAIGDAGTVARLGGGSMGVLLEPADLDSATSVIDRAILALEAHRLNNNGSSFSISARAGIVGITPQMDSVEDILAKADLACRSIDSSRNHRYCVFTEELQSAVLSSGSESFAALMHNLDQENLSLQYQPIVDLNCNEVSWFEALLAIRGADGRLSLIGNQLSVAEQHGVIGKFDRWALDKAVADLSSRPDLQGRCGITVNVSPSTVCDPHFAAYVIERLSHHDLAGDRLCLEVTEISGITDLPLAATTFDTLARQGCRLALDDFGTRSSSMEYLKYLPVNYLKINHVFLTDLLNNEMDQIICQSIVDLARRTGCTVIAESIENLGFVDALRKLGINYAQGYALGNPADLPDNPAELHVECLPPAADSRRLPKAS